MTDNELLTAIMEALHYILGGLLFLGFFFGLRAYR